MFLLVFFDFTECEFLLSGNITKDSKTVAVYNIIDSMKSTAVMLTIDDDTARN